MKSVVILLCAFLFGVVTASADSTPQSLSIAEQARVYDNLLNSYDFGSPSDLKKVVEFIFGHASFSCKPLGHSGRSCDIEIVDNNYDRGFTNHYGVTVVLDQNLQVEIAVLLNHSKDW